MGWTFLALAAAASGLPAYLMWTACRDKVGKIADRDLPRWNKAQTAVIAALGGASAVSRIQTGRK